MSVSSGWDAATATSARPIIPWRGEVWRAHKRRFEALDAGCSRLYSARYHRAPDLFPDGPMWAALYCGLSYGVCLAEVLRHVTPETLPTLKGQRLSRVTVDLAEILDCRDVAALGIDQGALFHDTDYTVGQALGAAAVARGCEGLVLPSATRYIMRRMNDVFALLSQGLLFLRAPHALRWRLETFGLYMPSFPETRPWWRVNRRALCAFLRQLPRYARWLGGMDAVRYGGAHGYWEAHTGTGLREWEEWLNRAEDAAA